MKKKIKSINKMGNQRVEMHYAFRQWGNNVDTTDNASGV
jgi:hypothetical protein